jgi:hypothetical protein
MIEAIILQVIVLGPYALKHRAVLAGIFTGIGVRIIATESNKAVQPRADMVHALLLTVFWTWFLPQWNRTVTLVLSSQGKRWVTYHHRVCICNDYRR